MLTTFDYLVIAVYLAGVALFGILVGGKQQTTKDYFLGGRDLPWWAVCFSVVATETSTLTVISIPAVAYGGSLTFLQLTFGYLFGRIVVSIWFLPKYFHGDLQTAYAFLGNRYGDGLRATASVTFMITRLLADGVRLFATAIPLKVIADSVGFGISYFGIIMIIGVATIAYTLVGGIKAVVWMDVVQMGVYVGGAILAAIILMGDLPPDFLSLAAEAGKTQLFDFSFDESITYMLTNQYAFVTAVVGGAIFSMASHGTDQLIVQRLLTCRNLADSRKALIGSGVVAMFQFGLFLVVGLLLWGHYRGATIAELGLTRADEIFPRFIIEGLPPGVSGLILAGIIAAAMSTLSSSLNALASSSVLDLYERITGRTMEEKRAMFVSRAFTLAWGIVFIGFANLFNDTDNPIVEVGLAIASFTYGGLLGAFLLGLLVPYTRQADAVIAFIVSIVSMSLIIFSLFHSPVDGWVFIFNPSAEVREALELRALAWPWYTALGAGLSLIIGSLLGLRHSVGTPAATK